MVRPRKEAQEKRERVLPPLRCTDSEYQAVLEKADQAGVSLSSYMRQILLTHSVAGQRSRRSHYNPALFAEIARIGQELQTMRQMCEGSEGDLMERLGITQAAFEAVLDEALPA